MTRVTARSRLLDIGWALFTNLFVLAGVMLWGWPPGNVFVLFWIENVILGVVTAVRIGSAQGVPAADPNARTSGIAPRWVAVGFFSFHYGVFALVHGVFVGIVAASIGVVPGMWTLVLPALLIALRYVVELATVWFLGGQRRHISAAQALAAPYPRLFVLHIVTLIGFTAVLPAASRRDGFLSGILRTVQGWFATLDLSISTGAALVALLMLAKTIADLLLIARVGKPLHLRIGGRSIG